jgi:hypothetical protein
MIPFNTVPKIAPVNTEVEHKHLRNRVAVITNSENE